MDKLKILENENQIKEHNKKYDLIILLLSLHPQELIVIIKKNLKYIFI